MLKKLKYDHSGLRMTILLQEFSVRKSSNSLLEVVRLLWQQKHVCVWVTIVLIPLVILNSCFLYSPFIHEEPQYPPHFDQHKLTSSSSIRSMQPNLQGNCDLSRGKWILDENPPLYTNETCRYIQPFQNCLKNGRPDTQYLHWRWKPDQCELPRFDAALFLQLMRGKKLLFFGDSLARNHLQSLLCSLSQVEEPEKVYTREDKDVRWGFPSFNFTLSIFWSPFLVRHVKVRDDPLLFKLHLDVPHKAWSSSMAEYNFAIVSASQWFFRPSIYSLNNTVIGCNEYSGVQNCTRIPFLSAFRIALNTTLKSLAQMQGYKGTTILRTASVEHFEYGSWSTGGKCNRTIPFETTKLGWMPMTLKRIQVEEFDQMVKKGSNNGSKFRLMNVTEAVSLRPDGHPGPYRLYHPFAAGGSDHEKLHAQNDCLHWCLPGPIDMWNQFLLEIVKEGQANFSRE